MQTTSVSAVTGLSPKIDPAVPLRLRAPGPGDIVMIMSDGVEQYWYNLSTNQVEASTGKGQGKDVMGPYPTHAAAQQALETARARTEAWDEADRRRDED